MNIAALKEQARALERRGDTAAALDVYGSIVTHLESSSVEPEAPLYVKMGDLSLKTGRAAAAIAMFERAAQRYAELGSHRSVIALCVKILRTDSARTDTYFTFARTMLEHEQVEAARLLLLDYAERARMRKTLSKLRELESAPDAKLKAMLERLLEVADRSAASAPARSAPPPQPTVTPSAPRPAISVSGPRPATPAPSGTAASTDIPPAIPQQPARPVRDTSIFEAISLPEPVTRPNATPLPPMPVPERESAPVAEPARSEWPRPQALPSGAPEHESEEAAPVASIEIARETAATVASAVQEEPSVPRRRTFGAGRRDRSARPPWAIPALAAAAVAVFGISLLALGAFSSGGELGAEPPRSAVEPLRVAAESPAAPQTVTPASAPDPDQNAGAAAEGSRPSPGAVATRGGFNAIQEREVEPVKLDQRALATASEAVKAVDVGSIDAPSADFVADAGRITTNPGALTFRDRSRSAPSPRAVRGPDIVIEGLEVEGVARSSASYQVVQRLPSGARITLTVEPFANAPAGETGVLRVQPIGQDSARGTVRFGSYFVTAQGGVTTDELGSLLDRLVERGE